MLNAQNIQAYFGKTIRKLRQERGMSQEAFAAQCDLDRTYVSSIERGKRNVALKNIATIANVLGVPISQLFQEAERG